MSSTSEPGPSRSGNPAWAGSDVIDFLTQKGDVFLFSYDPSIRTLIAWSQNSNIVLGCNELLLARDGNLFLRHVHQDDRFRVMNELEKALSCAEGYRITYRWIRPDNNECHWLHCRGAMNTSEHAISFDGFIVDITAELRSTDMKHAGADSVSGILSALSPLVFTLDKDLRLLRVNKPALEMEFNFGDPGFKAKSFQPGASFLDCFVSLEQRSRYGALFSELLNTKIQEHRTRVLAKDKTFALSLTPIFSGVAVDGILGVISDVSDEVRKESELAELQRSEGLRLLATGAAHNFNNALQSIIGEASAIANHPNNPALVQEASRTILDIVHRTSELSHQLFGGDTLRKEVMVPTDLNLCAITALNHIDKLFATGARVLVSFGNPPEVLARPEELAQIVESILVGFRDALASDNTISIRTFPVRLKEAEVANLTAGNYAKLSISDGAGQAGIFEGSTLINDAMPMIASFGGAICLEHLAGTSTAVSIYIPERFRQTVPVQAEKPEALSLQREILVVDDDLVVLRTMESILSDLGFGAYCAADYKQALEILRSNRATIKLILLDALMPGMDGLTLLKKIQRLAPEIKIIGFSGAPPETTKPMLEAGAIRILRKPIDPKTLGEILRNYLTLSEAA